MSSWFHVERRSWESHRSSCAAAENSPLTLHVLSFIGSNDDSGIMDILTLPDTREMVWRAIFSFLASNEDWDMLELSNLNAKAATCRIVKEESRRHRWSESSYQSPTVQMLLPQTWKEFLAGTSSKFRRQLALFERKLKDHYEITYTRPQTSQNCRDPCSSFSNCTCVVGQKRAWKAASWKNAERSTIW